MRSPPNCHSSLSLAAAWLLAIAALPAGAQAPKDQDAAWVGMTPGANGFTSWFSRVARVQAEQPHWMTPLVTVTPLLEEEYRYDQFWKRLPGGASLTSCGAGKGLELIPAQNVEVILGVPAWEYKNTSPSKSGWSDESFLLKYRLLSAKPGEGDYVATAFLGLSAPTGDSAFTSDHYVVTPTIALGKGWGDFDFQGTLGVSLPDNGSAPKGAGTPILLNAAFQYHLGKFFWPQVEANYTGWPNGEHGGLNQLFITPGLLLGRIPIAGRVGLAIGIGCQIAVTDDPLYRHNLVLSARLPF